MAHRRTPDYDTIYSNLNDEQKLAVDTTEGPVIVLAGPGTGKTQILSTRIASILQSDNQVQPENILCLTYSDAGRVAMRNRLSQIIGPVMAHNVHIHTFHSFCNELILSRPDIFKYDLQLISELDQMTLLSDILSNLSKDNILYSPKTNKRNIKVMKDYFDTFKKENMNLQQLSSDMKYFIDHIDENPDFIYQRKYGDNQKGDPKTKEINHVKRQVQKVQAYIDLFPLYESAMADSGYFDFSDMITWVISALETNEEFLSDVREQYQYFLIDEFQDTNSSQYQIIDIITHGTQEGRPNVFVVGDDDQSIYRFQGANMKNFLNFADSYSGVVKAVVLKDNYRSTQNILDSSQYIITQNKSRLIHEIPGLVKNLVAKNKEYAQLDILPRVWSFQNVVEEMIFVTKEVKALIDSGVRPNHIAILYHQHSQGELLAEYLQVEKVDYYMKKKADILKDRLGIRLINMIKYCTEEIHATGKQSNLLFEILNYDFWDIPQYGTSRLMMDYQKIESKRMSLREYIIELSQRTEELKDYESAIVEVNNLLEQLIVDTVNYNFPIFVNHLLTSTRMNEYIFTHPNPFWNLEVIRELCNLADLEYKKDADHAIENFTRNMDIMKSNNLMVSIEKLQGKESGVNLLTCHGSKGLEFEYVFIIGMTSNLWESKRGGSSSVSIPKEIWDSSVPKDEAREELRRLFFVALTRAEKQLAVSFSLDDGKGKSLSHSLFVEELLASNNEIKLIPQAISQEELEKIEWQRILNKDKFDLEREELDIVHDKVKNLEISVTALDKYLKCPVRFYYETLLKVPSGRSEALDFGTAVHNTLEDYYMAAKRKGEHLSLDETLTLLDRELRKADDKFMTTEMSALRDHAQDVIRNLYHEVLLPSSLNVIIEQSFSHKFDNGMVIKGKIDKIEVYDDHIVIVDYKTGNADVEKIKPPNLGKNGAGTINGYWLQGMFYKIILSQNNPTNKPIKDVEFLWVEKDENGNLLRETIRYDQAQQDYLMSTVYQAWEDIQNLQFEEGCNKPECEWCSFRKLIKQ